jgi:mannose-1-phosphate guanylyltransferase/mannose-6-phosphate isomerase
MARKQVRPVILAGGSGTRLWPVSRALYPKQFATLAGDRSLFDQTLARLAGLGLERPIIVGNEEHRFILAEQLRAAGITPQTLLLEPEGRNTAPAVALAAQAALAEDEQAILYCLPSDHWIGNEEELARCLDVALDAAQHDYAVAFGVRATSPHTGYGYLRAGEPIGHVPGAFAIRTFHEKPDAKTAESWVKEGGWFWNSGMFVFRARHILEEIAAFVPEIPPLAAKAMAGASHDGNFLRPERTAFLAMPSLSIDIAVMEKTRRGALVPAELEWTDLGDWDAVRRVLPQDGGGNTLLGDVVALGARDSVIRSDGPMVAAIGIDRLVVIATDDAVLVTTRNAAQDVRGVVERLKRDGRPEAVLHRTVHRPWGSYRSLMLQDRCQVKEITVRPGAELSLQRHHHRSEHWVVVRGTALVTLGDKQRTVHETESVYVPVGTPHRLTNPGKIPLKLIEVQTGSYLGEDDIVRLEDQYGRA